MAHLANPADIEFLLYDVFDALALTKFERYQDHDRTTFDGLMETARKIAEAHFLPHNKEADENEPWFDGDQVHTIDAVKTAWKHYADAGLIHARSDYELGGMQLPALLHTASAIYFMSANPATTAYPFLTTAAANVIHAFGSESQKNTWLPGMYSGRFAGTMCLTEPDVGSSLGDLTTRATRHPDGTYRIKGQKMYISGGDQDITDNIVHLVLARIDGAPPGVKGISLFIVPKRHVKPDGTLGEKNDVALAGLLHKMGYRGTTSTILSFGEHDQCVGTLIGEPHKGLAYMFKMMNEARIGVGLGSAAIGYRGYLESLDYARQRPQGRHPDQRSPESPPCPIIEHTDVKRMLLSQKAWVEGSLALCLFAARLTDEAEADHDADSQHLLDLLTPVVKSFPAWYGMRANELAIQVLGGAGYTREYPVEQCYRDNRLNPIHEGTHGIQSLDLLGRKLWQHNGKAQLVLLKQFQVTIARARTLPDLEDWAIQFETYLGIFQDTTLTLGQTLQQGHLREGLANSALFLDMAGKVVVSWLWLKMACIAQEKLNSGPVSEVRANFYHGKLQAARYFLYWELPEIRHQATLLKTLDRTCLDTHPDWF